jgi:drug/metabolite transporter (DMT)-like permease
MTRGISFGNGAGLLWGLAFVLPELIPRWSPVSITTGRYLAYGIVSVLIVAVTARRRPQTVAALRRHWRPAMLFAATGNVAYYLLLVVGVQAAGAPVATVVIGSIPVVIAAVANLREPRYRWRHLALPLAMVGVGLVTVSGPQLLRPMTGTVLSMAVGIAASVAAVAVWTSYGIGNATFLRRHPDMGGSLWSAIVGVYTGALALALVPLMLLIGPLNEGGGPTGSDLGGLLAVSAALGVAVSWGGTWLWNEASTRLSTTLAGLLIVTETISGYTYSYLLHAKLPAWTELFGFALVIAGVVTVTRLTPRSPDDGERQNGWNDSKGGSDGSPGRRNARQRVTGAARGSAPSAFTVAVAKASGTGVHPRFRS